MSKHSSRGAVRRGAGPGQRLRAAWPRARRWLPVTNLGLLLAGLAALGFWGFGGPRADYVIQLVSILALALLGLAAVVVVPGVLVLGAALRRAGSEQRERTRFEARRGFAELLRLPRSARWPLLELRWRWEDPEGFDVRVERRHDGVVEVVEALERGRAETITRRFEIEDAFGLFRWSFARTEPRAVEVLPWAGQLATSPTLRAHTGGDELSHPLGEPIGDRVEMRHYQPGDPLRLALWKIYARTGELMVRMPERAISPSLRIVAYLPAAAGDEPAAAAARVAVSGRLLGEGWAFAADGVAEVATAADEAIAAIVASKSARGTPAGDGAGLARFLETEAEAGRSRLLLFVPATPGPWLDAVVEALSGRSLPVTALVCTDGVEDERTVTPGAERWLRLPEAEDPRDAARTTPAQLEHVARTLAAVGAQVIGVERPTGRDLHLGGIGGRMGRVA